MIENEKQSRSAHVISVACGMMSAARTAPKARGVDNLEIIAVWGDDLHPLAEQMRRYGSEREMAFFERDAANVEEAQAVVLIGTRYAPFGLNCGFCGFDTCAAKVERMPAAPCAFNTNDLGIATGSAAAVAADNRVDSRVMYSVGKAALNMGLLSECRAAVGIVLNCTGKNPFFDRPAVAPATEGTSSALSASPASSTSLASSGQRK